MTDDTATRMCVYRLRLYPNREQERLFVQFRGATNRVYNWALEQYERGWMQYTLAVRDLDAGDPDLKRKKQEAFKAYMPNRFAMSRDLTQIKKGEDWAWVAEVQAQTLTQALIDCERAMQAFFRRLRNKEVNDFPRFRSKFRHESFRYQQGVRTAAKAVYLPKIGWVRYSDQRTPRGEIVQATVSRQAGKWFASVFCKETVAIERVDVTPETTIGVDFDFESRNVVLSTGEQIAGPDYLERDLKRLRKASRELSRKVKGSANFRKAVLKLQRIHEKIANQRRDHINKETTRLINGYNGFVTTNLDIAKALRGQKRPKSRRLYDMSPGEFRARLSYKADWQGKAYLECEGSGGAEIPATSRAEQLRAAGLAVLTSGLRPEGRTPVEGAANPLPGRHPSQEG